MWLIAIAMLAQSVGISGYVVDNNAQLVTMDGHVQIVRMGQECSFVDGSQNFTVIWGTGIHDPTSPFYGDVGAVLVTEDGQRCSVLTGDLLDSTPCATNDQGECDIAAE